MTSNKASAVIHQFSKAAVAQSIISNSANGSTTSLGGQTSIWRKYSDIATKFLLVPKMQVPGFSSYENIVNGYRDSCKEQLLCFNMTNLSVFAGRLV